MKVVVTGTRGIPNILGGIETHCEELFPRIAKEGWDISIIRRKNYTNDNLSEYKGVKLVDLTTPRKKTFEAIIHTIKAVWYARYKFHADIIHIHATGPALVTPVAQLLKLKVVFTHHGPDYERKKWGKAAKIILKFGERMGCMFANEVIVISDAINQIIKRKYNRYNAHLIYNGVSAPRFIQSTDYLDELGIQARKYLFAMGRFVPEKNFHHLIHAFTTLTSEDCKLVLAGDADFEDNYSKELKTLAQKAGVILTGFVKGEKLQALLTHAKVFVLPSSHEGLPISLLEAMSYRLPVIASNIPANLEIGLPSKCYFQAGNVQELAERLNKAIKEPVQPVNYDMRKYNWDEIAKQVIEVYNIVDAETLHTRS
jgi:glycosyltransferase involved in cell wall biosynthesis